MINSATPEPQQDTVPPVLLRLCTPLSFHEFYQREIRGVVGLTYVLSGSRSGAEDLAQDAFLAACRH